MTTPAKKDPRMPGASWVSPYLISQDVEKIIKFYQEAFGFELLEAVEGEEGQLMHAELRYQDQFMMVGLEGTYGSMRSPVSSGTECPIGLCVYVDDVDAFFEKAVKLGAAVRFAPDDMFWGDRACCIGDPDGYSWTFCTHTGKVPAHEHHHGEGCCGGH